VRRVSVSIARVNLMKDEIIEYLVGGKRFSELGSYKFDKLIFGSYILIFLFSFLMVFLFAGSDRSFHVYYSCDADHRDGLRCEQPFYLNYPICESLWAGACSDQFVDSGFSYGSPEPWIVKNWGLLIGLGLVSAFVINHLVHNRSFKFGGDLI